ncbi:MAG: four helix bundle protein [Planctomycetes bacterium]|nr:four helix bundle protein [Planctomycetota bacterium]
MLRSFKELEVWQKAYSLARDVYRVTATFPNDERFGLISQTRRAAVSIPSNIAEGYSRDTTRDYIRSLWIANGSLAELETQLMLAQDLAFGERDAVTRTLGSLTEVQVLLRALIESLRRKEARQRAPRQERHEAQAALTSSAPDPLRSSPQGEA